MTTTRKKSESANGSSKMKQRGVCSLRFAEAQIEQLLGVLDAVAWLTCPDLKQIAQFTGQDSKTAEKLVGNARTLGLLDSYDGQLYSLVPPYPFEGSIPQKRTVVREWMLRMPLLVNVRQFLALGDELDAALRKAAAVQRVEHFDPKALAPLLVWAKNLKALEPDVVLEQLYEDAAQAKKARHADHPKKRVVFLSHSSKDNAIVRQLATDLTTEGMTVWLHDQRVRPVESVSERMAQGLVESDYFLLGISRYSAAAPWAKSELNETLLDEIKKRETRILPLKLDDCAIPKLVVKEGFVDFSISYKDGLRELLTVLSKELGPIIQEAPEVSAGSIVAPIAVVTDA